MALDAELAALRAPLLRFAQLQLRDRALAEDAVSDTMLALLEKPEAFEGRSSFRTYAIGILKFKVIDILRVRGREVHIEPLDEEGVDDALDALFARDGHWQAPPAAWGEPERALEERQFFAVLEACVDRLSPKLARIFMMREWLERDVEEVCAELGITANNCHVMLFRARMALRECIDVQWFAAGR